MSDARPFTRAASDAVLDAAQKLFAAHGFAGTSLNEIGQAAGLSRGAPTYFFASKRGVYLAVLRRGLNRIDAAIGAIPAPTGPNVQDNVSTLVQAHLRVMREEADILRILQRDALDGWRIGEELAPELDRLRDRVEGLWATALSASDEQLRRSVAKALAATSAVWAFGPAAAGAIVGELDDESLSGYARVAAAMVCAFL
jgi:TetR/AcrR family transcriptional regulator